MGKMEFGEVEQLCEKARKLWSDKRSAEAILVAQEATRLAPDYANAWWRLAWAQNDHLGPTKAMAAYRKTVELAPGFGPGWYALGVRERDAGDKDAARTSLRNAAELDEDPVNALRALAPLYEDVKDADGELWALSQLELHGGEMSTYQVNRLGILHHNAKNFGAAINYYSRCARIGNDAAGWINLGLLYSEPGVSQDADAIDGLRKGKRLFPQHERFEKMLQGLVPRLLKLAKAVTASPKQLLATEQHYEHYVSPIEALHLDEDESTLLDNLSGKEMQRAKKRLLQEIELEDGAVGWVPGLRLDRSRAIGLADELTHDETARQFHFAVYDDPSLLDFLCRGELRHFLVTDASSYPCTSDKLDELEGFAEWLSPIFAAQYGLVFAKAIERRDVFSVECMLDGRRWVLPQHDELCFGAAKRLVARMIEPLEALAKRCKTERVSAGEVQRELNRDHCGAILGFLPNHFHEQLNRVCDVLRIVSLTAYNEHGDADEALAVTEMATPLTLRSLTLQHRVEEDRKQLKQLIADESRSEIRLTLNGTPLEITRKHVTAGGKTIAVDKVTSVRWGVTVTRGNGAPTYRYQMRMTSQATGSTIVIDWSSTDAEKQTKFFESLLNAALTYVMPSCVKRFADTLEAGESRQVGPLLVSANGVRMTIKGWFSDKAWTIAWPSLRSEARNGAIVVSDATYAKATAELSMTEVDNAVLLHYLNKAKQRA